MAKRTQQDIAVGRDPAAPVTFPVVSPAVTDPAALRYQQEAQARRSPARYSTPVAGGSGPPIPRLDEAATTGLTMADQAHMQRMQAAGPPPGSLFQGGPPPGMSPGPLPPAAPSRGPTPPPAHILPADILPEEARQDPEFREGQGSMYASSQPHLATRYGVIRAGVRIPPQQLGQARKGLKPETIQGLQALQDARQRAEAPSEQDSIFKESVASSAGAAGRLGNSPENGPQAESPDAKSRITEAVKNLDDMDFNRLREMMMKDIINNEEQRKIIEARCQPLSIDDLIVSGSLLQRVPIIPGKFEVTFRSMTGEEDLAIKRLIVEESKGLEVSDRYLLDKFSLMAVAVGLHAINSNPLPSHLDDKDAFSKEAFLSKFARVTRLPFHMLASIGVNYFWFDLRVRHLFVAENLGNG